MMKKFSFLLALFAATAQAYETGPAHTVLRVPGAGGRAKMGAVDISQSAAVTGVLRPTNGGSDSAELLDNCTLSVTASAGTITVALKDKAGSNPSASSPCRIAFRDATTTSGLYNIRSITGALSLSLAGATTLGIRSGVAGNVFVYAFDDAGTVTLGASLLSYRTDKVRSSSTSATSAQVIYQPSALSSKPIRLFGRFTATNTAGSWASPTEVVVGSVANLWKPITLRVYRNSTQSIPNATGTAIVWNSFPPQGPTDPLGMLNTSTGVITVMKSGKYLVGMGTYWDANGSGQRLSIVNVSGNDRVVINRDPVSAGSAARMATPISNIVMTAGDTIEGRVFQSSGGSLNHTGTGDNEAWLELTEVDET